MHVDVSRYIHRTNAVSSVAGTTSSSVKPRSARASLCGYICCPWVVWLPHCLHVYRKLEYIEFLLYFTFKAAAQSLRSVCHTTVNKRLHLYGSWCSKYGVIAWSHMDPGVFGISSQICSSAVRLIMIRPMPPPPPPPLPIFSPFGCLLGLLCCFAAFSGCTEASLHCWLSGGDSFLAGCDWASAPLSSGVTAHTRRCYRSRFGGATLLTRSPLRQAASNSAEKRAILSAADMTDSWWCA